MLRKPDKFIFIVITSLFFVFVLNAQKTKRIFECKDVINASTVRWTLIDDPKALKLPAKSNNIQLPKKYDVFSVTAINLGEYCTYLRENSGSITLPVPDTTGFTGFRCISFTMQNSGTMSAALNAKYPEIVSLKGYAVNSRSNTIRFDYDGKSMNISVIWNGINYLYVPYRSKSKTYYLLYKKVDNIGSSRVSK